MSTKAWRRARLGTSEPWYRPVRAIHDEHFYDPWEEHLARLNARYGLQDDDVLLTHGPGLPPPWFNGDIESIEPGQWVLVISLNPKLNPRDLKARDRYCGQGFTPATYWDHWRRFNVNHWYPRFFSPLATLAAGALGLQLEPGEMPRFAANRMLFIELCPYGSQKFRLPRQVVGALVEQDEGFKLAAEVRRVLIERGALILVNGNPAVEDLEAVEGKRLSLTHIGYDSVDTPPLGKRQKRRWHKQGRYVANGLSLPVVGFPFLKAPFRQYSNAELLQLGTHIQQFLRGEVWSGPGASP
jgi:hypothetical protein